MNFKPFATTIRNRFNYLTADKNRLVYRSSVSGDELWDTPQELPRGHQPHVPAAD